MRFEIDLNDVGFFKTFCDENLGIVESDLKFYHMLIESGRFAREDLEEDEEYIRLIRARELFVGLINQIVSAIEN